MGYADQSIIHPEQVVDGHIRRSFIRRRPSHAAILACKHANLGSDVKPVGVARVDGHGAHWRGRKGAGDIGPVCASVISAPDVACGETAEHNQHSIGVVR